MQLKTYKTTVIDKTNVKHNNFRVKVMNSKAHAQVKGKNCSRGTNSRLPFAVNVTIVNSKDNTS